MTNTKKHIFSFLLFLLLIASDSAKAQYLDPREAKMYFNRSNYLAALRTYNILLQKERNNKEYNYNIGICYLRTNIDKAKAIHYLERVITFSKFDEEALYNLAMAYQYGYRFDEAIKEYNKYKASAKGKNLDKVDRQIETCYSAKELIKYPIEVTFENLGPDINSEFPDYYPFVAKDESFIVFTTRRGGIIEFDGYYSSDIWESPSVNGKFLKARSAGYLVNSDFDEQAVGLSDDAKTVFVYLDQIKEFGDIYTSVKTRTAFEKIEKMSETVNSNSFETSASISADGNTLFFTSARDGSYGGLDLYMTRRLPTGEWALPQNLGSDINTKYDEDFPTLSGDGQTLYFCSEGHASMGGYDIFTSTWNPESNSWSVPKNIGYPLNTPEDNRTISFSEDGSHAYISACRKDGIGDLDIYKIIFPKDILVRLQIPSGDDRNPFIIDAFVSVINIENDEPVGDYTANPNNGFYTIALKQPGKYELMIEAEGNKLYVEKMIFYEKENLPPVITKIIKLVPE
ncbi:MAG: hypothetical protein ABII90_12625 [Bacteroidota bacterium]